VEYDSNANRAEVSASAPGEETDTPTGSFLIRTTARIGAQLQRGRHLLRASALAGGKVFFNDAVRDQNALVGQLTIEDRVSLTRRLDATLFIDYFDAFQQTVTACAVRSCDRHRDFRSGTVGARLRVAGDPGEATVQAGWRGFQWKPDPAFDFHAPQLALSTVTRLRLGREGTSELDLGSQYLFERRLYRGLQQLSTCPPGTAVSDTCIEYGDTGRADWFQQAGLELTYVGPILASLSYGLQLTSSNSFGQSMLRQLVAVKLSARLPGQLYVTLKGQLLVNRTLDDVLLGRQVNSQTLVSIEDENRNALLVDLERPLGASGVALGARYSYFTNELGAGPASFQRHVALVGATYRWSGSPVGGARP
jgi:hypothetical protein